MDKYVLYHDLLEAIRHDHCPVCELVEQRMKRSIRVMLREGAADGEMVASYVKAKGFCNAHAWQVKEEGSPAAQAVFYRALLEKHKQALAAFLQRAESEEARKKAAAKWRNRLLVKLPELPRRSDVLDEFLGSFASEERCPLCVMAEACERRYVEATVDYFESDEDFRERYRNRGMLCQPHLRRLAEEHAHRSGALDLMRIQLGRLDLCIEHLREIEISTNRPHSKEEHRSYRGGWSRAVRLDVGLPGMDTHYKLKRRESKLPAVKP